MSGWMMSTLLLVQISRNSGAPYSRSPVAIGSDVWFRSLPSAGVSPGRTVYTRTELEPLSVGGDTNTGERSAISGLPGCMQLARNNTIGRHNKVRLRPAPIHFKNRWPAYSTPTAQDLPARPSKRLRMCMRARVGSENILAATASQPCRRYQSHLATAKGWAASQA